MVISNGVVQMRRTARIQRHQNRPGKPNLTREIAKVKPRPNGKHAFSPDKN